MVDFESKGWIETYSGERFELQSDCIGQVDPIDIAHALSMLVRYNGHVKSTHTHYSVAEHCCHLTDYVLNKHSSLIDALTILHHEDPEAYIGDLARPVKQLCPDFSKLEDRLARRMAKRFGTTYPFPDWLKEYDARILCDEREQVMNKTDHEWPSDHLQPLGIQVACWHPSRAKYEWMRRHEALSAICFRTRS